MATALGQLKHWIKQYKRINGTPPIDKVLVQIDLLKESEKANLKELLLAYEKSQYGTTWRMSEAEATNRVNDFLAKLKE